jgi:Ca2+-binding RTX toxin-like protein
MMRPLAPVLTALALAAGLNAVARPALAVGESCRGVPATIAASGVLRVDGTEGNDVIVADNVNAVHAQGGDDLICVTGSVFAFVDADAGNDVVDASSRAGRTTALLGDGDDTYLGSAAVDDVRTGTVSRADLGRDVVDAGPAGAELDFVTSGWAGSPNPDEIIGGWTSLDWAGTPAPTSVAQAGRGSTFALDGGRVTTLRIDIPARTLTTSGTGPALTLRGFTVFSLRAPRDLERFTFHGSNRDESLFVPGAGLAIVRAAMGGGDDTMQVGTYAKGSSLSGGHGRDLLDVRATAHLDLDLRKETLTKRSGRRIVNYEVSSFEDAFVRGTTARLVGTNGPNKLSTDACSTWTEGLGGRDRLTAFNTGFDQAGDKCKRQSKVTARLSGGPGNDTLKGSNAKDLLIGGPGRDRADGDLGRDICDAEVRRNCEVRR